jgi:MFS family permease
MGFMLRYLKRFRKIDSELQVHNRNSPLLEVNDHDLSNLRMSEISQPPMSSTSSQIQTARIVTLAIFFLNGFAIANWAVRIPALKAQIGLSEGTLGLALLCIAIGSVGFMPIVGRLIAKRGSSQITRAMGFAFPISMILLALPNTIWLWIPVLIFYGATNGGLDVSMNAQATTVEKRLGRPILNSFHAFWSVGSLIGAGVGGLFARAEIIPSVHLGLIGVLELVIFAIITQKLLTGDADPNPQSAGSVRPTLPLLLIALVAFSALMSEGAIADWSAVYLKDDLNTNAFYAALGLVFAQGSMAACRFAGDALTLRFGPSSLLRWGGALSATGLAFALFSGLPWAALLGFACVGAGMSVIFPVTISAVSRLPGVASGAGIAWVASFGYAGFLVGPPVIGFLAEWTNLRIGLAAVVVFSLLIVLLANAVEHKTEPNLKPGEVA